jgi:hypothetical protein
MLTKMVISDHGLPNEDREHWPYVVEIDCGPAGNEITNPRVCANRVFPEFLGTSSSKYSHCLEE